MALAIPSAVQGVGTLAYNTYQQTATALAGNPNLVHFLDTRTGACIFQFDAVLNETHAADCQITSFPVDNGQTVTDHIVVSPPTLTVQGIVTDSPIMTKGALLQEAIATGVTALAPPLLIAAAGVGYAASSSSAADKGTDTPSQTAFAKLQMLQLGDAEATPPIPPQLVHVHTKMRVYTNMAIKQVTLPRDRTVSNAVVVQIQLQKMNIVKPASVRTARIKTPSIGAIKTDEGSKTLQTKYSAELGFAEGRASAFDSRTQRTVTNFLRDN